MISSNLECKWIIMLPRQKKSTDFYLQVPQAGSWWLERPHQLLLTSRPRSAPPEREREKNGLIRISLQSYHPKFAPPSSCAGTSDFQAGEKIWHLNPTTALVCLSYISNEKSDLRATEEALIYYDHNAQPHEDQNSKHSTYTCLPAQSGSNSHFFFKKKNNCSSSM